MGKERYCLLKNAPKSCRISKFLILFRAMSRGGFGVSGLYYTVRLDLLAEIISIPACILAILVVLKVSALEKDLVEPAQISDPMDHLIA
jgi:hypothetical protein